MSFLLIRSDPQEKHSPPLRAIGWQVDLHSYSWNPPTDVYETDTSFVIRVEVAGMHDADFSITVERDYLVVSGVRMDSNEHRSYHQMEIRSGEFSTGVELPPEVDSSRAEADYHDGFLTILLPKFRPTEIQIKS
jgi:HSP20 family protein